MTVSDVFHVAMAAAGMYDPIRVEIVTVVMRGTAAAVHKSVIGRSGKSATPCAALQLLMHGLAARIAAAATVVVVVVAVGGVHILLMVHRQSK